MEERFEMKKIVLTGPESTGKTLLSRKLADHLNCNYIPEIARVYLENKGENYAYTHEDVLEIAKLQIQEEENFSNNNKEYLILDTDLIITKVWLKLKYNKVPNWLDEYIANTPRHIHLLCYPDLPWEEDPLRENPDIRLELFEMYLKEIEYYGFNYAIIKGEGKTRFLNALSAIKLIETQD